MFKPYSTHSLNRHSKRSITSTRNTVRQFRSLKKARHSLILHSRNLMPRKPRDRHSLILHLRKLKAARRHLKTEKQSLKRRKQRATISSLKPKTPSTHHNLNMTTALKSLKSKRPTVSKSLTTLKRNTTRKKQRQTKSSPRLKKK